MRPADRTTQNRDKHIVGEVSIGKNGNTQNGTDRQTFEEGRKVRNMFGGESVDLSIACNNAAVRSVRTFPIGESAEFEEFGEVERRADKDEADKGESVLLEEVEEEEEVSLCVVNLFKPSNLPLLQKEK